MIQKKEANDIFYLSPSTIKSYSACPMAYRKRKQSGADIRSEPLDFGRWIHRALEMAMSQQRDVTAMAKAIFVDYALDIGFFKRGVELLENVKKTRDYFRFKPILVEKELRYILPNGVGIKGIIDVVIERGKKTIEVIDYKSGLRPLGRNYLKSDIQMAIYNLLVRHRYPGYNHILITVDALQYEPQTIESVDIDNDVLLAYLKEIYNAIFVKKLFPARYNSGCGWCHYSKSCPLMKDLAKKKIELHYDLSRTDDGDVANEFFRMDSIIRVAKNRKEKAKTYFEGLLGDDERKTFPWGTIHRGAKGIMIRSKTGVKK